MEEMPKEINANENNDLKYRKNKNSNDDSNPVEESVQLSNGIEYFTE